jgi:hypothetical protein
LRKLVPAKAAVQGALASRMITIRIRKDEPYGVLTSLPKGCSTSQRSIEAVRAAIDEHYGSAGRAFIARVVEAATSDQEGLRRFLQKRMAGFLERVERDHRSARVRNAFALTYAAGRLARDWGILPKAWGPLLPAILTVYRSVQPPSRKKPTALDRIKAYREKHRSEIVRASALSKPYTRAEFDTAAGFTRKGQAGEELLVPSTRLKAEFPDHVEVMRELRRQGVAKTERGENRSSPSKLPKKSARWPGFIGSSWAPNRSDSAKLGGGDNDAPPRLSSSETQASNPMSCLCTLGRNTWCVQLRVLEFIARGEGSTPCLRRSSTAPST